MPMGEQRSAKEAAPPPQKKAYITPSLIVYGGLTELTKEVGATTLDGLVGSRF
ncbi:MAG: hypothetical protein ACREON_11980 [Gemmatimonadaceae bacterium]